MEICKIVNLWNLLLNLLIQICLGFDALHEITTGIAILYIFGCKGKHPVCIKYIYYSKNSLLFSSENLIKRKFTKKLVVGCLRVSLRIDSNPMLFFNNKK